MLAIFTPSVKVSGSTIPDFRSFEVTERVGVAEKSFNVELDRPTNFSTEDTIDIGFSIGGATFSLVDDKRIEVSGNSTMQTSLRAQGSLISRYGPEQTIIFINQTWLKKICPTYYFRDGIIYKSDPGATPLQWKGVSSLRLFIPYLPGKNVRDCEFKCVLQSGISYYDIAKWIGSKIGYNVHTDCPTLYVQRAFNLNVGENYFQALSRLYQDFHPMIHIENNTVHILDKGGNAQTGGVGTSGISMTEDSFSLLSYETTNTDQIVDHVIILGATSQWAYTEQSSLSTTRNRYTEAELYGDQQTLVYETSYTSETSEYLGLLQTELAASGIDMTDEEVFEYLNRNADKNGRQVRTVEVVTDPMTGESATTKETISTYNVSDVLVHEVVITNKWADFHTSLGHTEIEKARLGVVQGGTTESAEGGYKTVIPASYEFIPIMGKYVRFGDYIGETGQVDADIDEYHAVVWYKDSDTVDDVDVSVRTTPQIITRNSLIGVTPYTWETSDDPETSGWEKGFFLTRRERVRYDTLSQYLLMKIRHVEEMLPIKSDKTYTENIPLKRNKSHQDTIQARWEFFKVGDSITEWNGKGTMPVPTRGPGTLPGQVASFHPAFTLSNPDLTSHEIATRIAQKIFDTRVQDNVVAQIRTTIPIPGLRLGTVMRLPACTKTYLRWSTGSGGSFSTVTLSSQMLWVTGITTKCVFSGSIGSAGRTADIYQEIELRKNY